MQNPLVSVIIPNYCHARYLNQRIDSVLAQTYQNFELIILDDCSPDEGESRKVIEQYRDNPHVSHIVYNEVNSGSTFKQWDKGISLAKGELIWIAESDDFCESNFLEVLVKEFVRDKKVVLVYSLTQIVDEDGLKQSYWRLQPHGVTRLNGNKFVQHYMSIENHCSNASAAIFRKNIYMECERAFTTYRAGGDALFWIEVAKHGNVSIVNKQLSYFRRSRKTVTPVAVRQGISFIESLKTHNYILCNFDISDYRKKWMLKNMHYRLLTKNFDSEDIRRELLACWNLNDELSLIERIIIKTASILRHRLGIFI